MPNDVGRPSELTPELFVEIKQLVLAGNYLKEIAKIKGINEQTLYKWHENNYLNFYDKVEGWRRDRKLMLAEKNIEAILDIGVSDKDSIKVVADISKFVAETLGKDNYAKRNEMTGKNGTDLLPKPLLAGQSNENRNETENI